MVSRVIVVLGMDRSGTSLCTNLLNSLGMQLGPDLLPGDQFNEPGYFEDREIWSIHERIFAVLGHSWDTLTAIRPFPPLWWRSQKMLRFQGLMTELVRARASAADSPWGFKDPRTAALLPLWHEVFQSCGVQPVYVLCLRHPAGVAASLAARDGFPKLFSELLWLERNLAACEAIQNSPHCIVHYEEWFCDALPQLENLIDVTGVMRPEADDELRACLSRIVQPGLNHDKPDPPSVGLPAAQELYTHLRDAKSVPAAEVLRPFAAALELARDCVAVAQQLNGRNLRASMQSASYDECTFEDLEVIYKDLPGMESGGAADGDQAALRSAVSTLTAQLTGSTTVPVFNFDLVAGVATPFDRQGPPIPVAQQGNLVVIGWAVDSAASKPASAVEVLIDGRPFRAEYGVERADVANQFGVPDYLNCGFALTMNARLLRRGYHVLAVRVVSADGSSYEQGPEVTIAVL
jgi:hypothetical protein